MNLDYLKPYSSWTPWLYNKGFTTNPVQQQIPFHKKMSLDLFPACKRSILEVLNLCKNYCGALIWIIKKERKPTSFSNWRHLELICIIKKKKEIEIYSGAIVNSSQISPTEAIWNCCQFISNFSKWRHYFEVFWNSDSFGAWYCINGNHNWLNLCKLRNQLQVLANSSIVSFYKIW
jgi:hypothetical protein